MQRLKNRAQFDAVLAGGSTVSRTVHFALHRAALKPPAEVPVPPVPEAGTPGPTAGPRSERSAALFAVQDQPWIGAVVPKRWARRAVTRNAIKRQIYTVSQDFEAQLPVAAHVVRLRVGFDKAQFHSATSPGLKKAVREELQQLFAGARK